MKFGLLYIPTYVPELDGPAAVFYNRMLEQIARADELGYEGVWITEHHFHEYGGMLPNPAVFGATIAHATQRIRIGTAVTVVALHNPLIIAEDFAMLDVLSQGRVDLGVGRGSVPAEFREFGIDANVPVTDEGIEIILRAWTDETFEFHGKHFNYDKISLLPRPIQRPHPPIWVGATRTPATFEWAGLRDLDVMVLPYMFPPEFLQERLAIYRAALQESGHDPSTREVLAKFHVFVADDMDEARRYASPAYEHYKRIAGERSGRGGPDHFRAGTEFDDLVRERKFIAGSPAECIEQIRYWQETLGITYISGVFHFGGLDQAAAMRSIELFAREVAPAFAPAPASVAVA